MYIFYETWKNRNQFSIDPPEWVKKFETNIEGRYITNRVYDLQQIKK